MFSIDSLFARAGAHFLTGSGATAFGTLPGLSLITELDYLSHIGLNNREVLAAATNNFSILWDWNHIGSIESGRVADILVLNKNPLESLNNLKEIDLLLLKGKMIDRASLLQK
jgi:imidazolonepropionase-like amidohydrolase